MYRISYNTKIYMHTMYNIENIIIIFMGKMQISLVEFWRRPPGPVYFSGGEIVFLVRDPPSPTQEQAVARRGGVVEALVGRNGR